MKFIYKWLFFIVQLYLVSVSSWAQCYEGTAGENDSVCGTTYQLKATDPGVAVGRWRTTSKTAIIDNSASFNTTVRKLMFGENVFIWTVTQDGCSDFVDEVVISNNFIQAEADSVSYTVCRNNTVSVIAKNPLPGSGFWQMDNPKNAKIITPDSSTTLVTDIATNPYQHEIIWTVNYKSCTDAFNIRLQNFSIPEPDAGKDTVVCSFNYEIEGKNLDNRVGTFVWLSDTTSNAKVVSETLKFIASAINDSVGTYYLKFRDKNYRCVLFDSVTVTYYKVSAPTIDTVPKLQCSTKYTIQTKEPFGPLETGKWTTDVKNVVIANPSNASTEVSNLPPGVPVTFTLIVNKGGCLSYPATVTVGNYGITAFIVDFKDPTCEKANGEITATASPSIYTFNYFWNDMKGDASMYNLDDNKYNLKVTNKDSCAAYDTIKLQNIGEVPELAIEGARDILLDLEGVPYKAIVTNDVEIKEYHWSAVGATIVGSGKNITLKFGESANVLLSLRADAFCPVEISTSINVVIPGINQNILFPFGSDIYDFIIEEIRICEEAHASVCYPNSELLIYNSWGNLVYQASPYKNDWRGYANQGEQKNKVVPNGTYYYIFKLDKAYNNTPKTGYVVIIH